MTGYDFNKPFVDSGSLPFFRAIDAEVASRYGTTVRATQMSNSDYARRHSRLAGSNNMKQPPSHGRIFDGYLVVRKIDTSSQYETWIPHHAFDEIYGPI